MTEPEPRFEASAIERRSGNVGDAIDDVVPHSFARPSSEREVVELVRAAGQERCTLICTGGRTSIEVGHIPRAFDVAVDMRALDEVIEHRREDMTITVQAGLCLRSLAAKLALRGQRIAWDPHAADRATVGGVLASDSTGGFAYGFGQPRDLVLGIVVVDGRARRLRLGGRVVKNVAGYDLVRLFTGSHGSLGIITEATLRTHPLPELACTLTARFLDAADMDRARARLFASSLPLTALDFSLCTNGPRSDWSLWMRIEGSARQIAAQRDRINGICDTNVTEDTHDWASPVHAPEDANLVIRVGVAPARAIAFAHELALGPRPVRIGGRLGDGTLRISALLADNGDAAMLAGHIRALAHQNHGVAILERLPTALKRELDIWDAGAGPVTLLREIKKRFDPDAVLAPGRFVGGI